MMWLKARFYESESAEYRKGCSIMELPQSRSAGFLPLHVGTWLSLVEHSLGVRGVGSSNLPVPTIYLFTQVQPLLVREFLQPTHEAPQRFAQKRKADAPGIEALRGGGHTPAGRQFKSARPDH